MISSWEIGSLEEGGVGPEAKNAKSIIVICSKCEIFLQVLDFSGKWMGFNAISLLVFSCIIIKVRGRSRPDVLA